MNRLRLSLGSLLVLTVLLVGCGGVTNPEGWAPPVTENGVTYVFQKKDRLSAIDAATGSVRWAFPDDRRPNEEDIDLKAVYGAPVITASAIYLASYDGELFALSPGDGRLLWMRSDIAGSIVDGPVLGGDRLYFGTTEGRVYARSIVDGAPAAGWPQKGVELDKGVWAPPVAATIGGQARVYVATMGGQVYALDAANGNEIWGAPFEADGAIADLALIEGERLFVPSLSKHVHIIRADDGSEILDFTAEGWVWTQPAVLGDRVFFGDFKGNLYGLDITRENSFWQYKADDTFKAAPVVIGEVVVAADRGPSVHFLNAADGTRLGNIIPLDIDGTVRADLVANDGKALVATTKGRLFAADPEFFRVVQITLGQAPRMIVEIFTLLLLDPMINFLVLLNNLLFGSFGLAIIAFTVIIRVLTFPLTLRQLHQSRAMQELAPKIQEAGKKHSDPKRRQEETMRLYREAGINPLGCLGPMLLQIPVLFALFWAVQRTLPESPEALEKLSASLYDWSYLQQAVPMETHFLGLDLRDPNLALVLLVALTTYAQSKTTITVTTDERARAQQQMMLYMMPVMFAFFALGFPSGVSLYWVVNSLVGIGFNVLTYGFPLLKIEPVFKRKVSESPPSPPRAPDGTSKGRPPKPAQTAPELRTANGLGRSKRQNRRRRP